MRQIATASTSSAVTAATVRSISSASSAVTTSARWLIRSSTSTMRSRGTRTGRLS